MIKPSEFIEHSAGLKRMEAETDRLHRIYRFTDTIGNLIDRMIPDQTVRELPQHYLWIKWDDEYAFVLRPNLIRQIDEVHLVRDFRGTLLQHETVILDHSGIAKALLKFQDWEENYNGNYSEADFGLSFFPHRLID